MKNRMNERSSDGQARTDRALYFTDQLCADEVANLLNPQETLPKDVCSMWKSVFDDPVSKTRRGS